MKYGFVIDNRKCIGCHACTTACKSEHQVPIGVNRTWVKQVEKGEFPHTRRLFSVLRCNHCTDAPCVTICPTQALHYRDDGIVDFDKDRCIGCKSCMQACPYDALYIDPETHTAAKCNYCAHRIDVGLEPACVNVCPEHAIISGDMDDPTSEISELLARQAVKVRKPEKATQPNLFYIDADDVSLVPTATEKTTVSLWGSQAHGVGHFAKEAEKMAYTNPDVISQLVKDNGHSSAPPKSVEVLMNKGKQVYNTPDKGILWGWEVSGYVWTKAIAAGVFIILLIAQLLGAVEFSDVTIWSSIGIGFIFLLLTGLLLIKDLDRPDRFPYVLLRPHWNSWLVKGGYAITIFGALIALLAASQFFDLEQFTKLLVYAVGIVSIVVAIYTAFLFAQAKGRDFWQSPMLALHMLVHSVLAGVAVFSILQVLWPTMQEDWATLLHTIFIGALTVNLVTIFAELFTKHPTSDAKKTVGMILHGQYKYMFWGGALLIGNVIPLFLLAMNQGFMVAGIASVLVLIGMYITEHIWVEAPQKIPLS